MIQKNEQFVVIKIFYYFIIKEIKGFLMAGLFVIFFQIQEIIITYGSDKQRNSF